MIEQFWDDIIIYFVEYTSLSSENKVQSHQKAVIFNSVIIEKELEHIIMQHIDNIIQVISIDEITDGLFFKKM
ncbi:MAG: hypothetical protein ACTIDE_10995 [Carnobacterium maltaromaticum]